MSAVWPLLTKNDCGVVRRSSKSSFKVDLLRKPSVSLNLVLNFTFDGWLIVDFYTI